VEAQGPSKDHQSRPSLFRGGRTGPRLEEEGSFPGPRRCPRRPPCSPRSIYKVAKLRGVSEKAHFSAEEARAAGERIGVDWKTSQFDVEQFRKGMDVELEHGTQDLDTNVTDDDVTVTAKIARAHLNEFPDYYSRLAVMETEAQTYWAGQRE
jgi:Protein of unknown function (DUF5661)